MFDKIMLAKIKLEKKIAFGKKLCLKRSFVIADFNSDTGYFAFAS